MNYKMEYQSPLCSLTLASDGENLTGLWLAGQKYFADTVKGEMTDCPDLPVFQAAARWLDGYFAGEKPEISELPLKPEGGAFRQLVWQLLCEIPYGATVTYGELAAQVAARQNRTSMSAQAVGGAVGRNPISIIIPCHRVVGAQGKLTGYAGGLDKKIWLLRHEGVKLTEKQGG